MLRLKLTLKVLEAIRKLSTNFWGFFSALAIDRKYIFLHLTVIIFCLRRYLIELLQSKKKKKLFEVNCFNALIQIGKLQDGFVSIYLSHNYQRNPSIYIFI